MYFQTRHTTMDSRQTRSVSNIFQVIFCIWLLFTAGCGGEQFQANTELKQFQAMHQARNNRISLKEGQAFSTQPLPVADAGEYLLGPGDLIVVTVFETKDLNTEARVSSRGYVSLPLLNEVNVYNLSAAEAEEKIEKLFKKNYLHDPHVSIYIKEHVSKQITLVGAVKNPGTYDYVSKRRLLDVIAIGDGLDERAGSVAYITREDKKTKKNINYLVDLDSLIKDGNMEQNFIILGGDVIFVPESGQCFVDGAVRQPGTYPLKGAMTITEVIALAGGLASWADNDSIKLIRYMGRGQERQIVSLSYDDLQGGVGDTLFLQDQDIVFAESSASGTLFSGSGFTLGFMGTGVSFKNPQIYK